MGQSRTLGAVRSYFSKNRKRLDFDRIAEEAQARAGGADELSAPAQQVSVLRLTWPPSASPGDAWLLS